MKDVSENAVWFYAPGSSSTITDYLVWVQPGDYLKRINKGQQLTMRFQITNYPGCFLPLRGEHGTIVEVRS